MCIVVAWKFHFNYSAIEILPHVNLFESHMLAVRILIIIVFTTTYLVFGEGRGKGVPLRKCV